MSAPLQEPEQRFGALYEECYPRVLAYCARRRDADLARDVAADVFLVAWRRFDDVPVDPLPWLITIAQNCLRDHARSGRRRERLQARMTTTRGEAISPDPADAVTEHALVHDALAQLGQDDQEILRLVAWEDLSTAQLAAVLRCSTAAARVRLHRARKRFRRALAAHDDQNPITATPATSHNPKERRP